MCSKNKRADQLCIYCTADLSLCFRICKLLIFDGNRILKISYPHSLKLFLNVET